MLMLIMHGIIKISKLKTNITFNLFCIAYFHKINFFLLLRIKFYAHQNRMNKKIVPSNFYHAIIQKSPPKNPAKWIINVTSTCKWGQNRAMPLILKVQDYFFIKKKERKKIIELSILKRVHFRKLVVLAVIIALKK